MTAERPENRRLRPRGRTAAFKPAKSSWKGQVSTEFLVRKQDHSNLTLHAALGTVMIRHHRVGARRIYCRYVLTCPLHYITYRPIQTPGRGGDNG